MRLVAPRTRLSAAFVSAAFVSAAFALVLALAWLGFIASSARAEAWGQVKSFPFTGAEPEQMLASTLVRFAAGSDGSYYVLTGNRATGEYELKRFYEGKLQAKVSLKGEEEVGLGTEGTNEMLAVDPSRDRVYVLLVYERRGPNAKEEKEEVFPLDSEMPAAGALYSFEYKPATEELVKSKSVTRKALKGEGEVPKEALLDPRGIAVEPVTGDLAISGNEDEESQPNVEKGAQKQCRAAAQFVTVKSVETGAKKGDIESMSSGARYVDTAGKVLFGKTGCGNTEEEEEAINQAPASPVFAPDGTLLGYGEDELVGAEVEGIIWQLAPSGADAHAPGEVTMTPKELFVAEAIPAFEPGVGVWEEPASVMSLVGESSTKGTIYLSGGGAANKQPATVVLSYNDPSGDDPAITEVGVTAGGATNENAGAGPCDLHKPKHEPVMLGGLGGSKPGFLALTYYVEKVGPGHEEEVPRAEVLEFGEGGNPAGCPTAPVTTPTQEYHGAPTSEVPASTTPLAVTSELGTVEKDIFKAAAGAKRVEWDVKFTTVAGKVEPEQHSETEYEFNGLHEEGVGYGTILGLELDIAQPGTYEIRNVVHSDDLADQVVESAVDKLSVAARKLKIETKLPKPTEIFAHEEAQLSAGLEVPGEETLRVKKVIWEFGDGSPKVEETALKELVKPAEVSIKHAFSRCGTAASTKCTIKLTVEVETTEGVTEASGHFEITVKESKAEEETAAKKKREEEEAAAKKKKEKEAEEAAAKQKAAEEAAAKQKAAEEAAAKKAAEEAAAKKAIEEEQQRAKGGVAAYIASFSGSSLSVSAGGSTAVTITCPSGGSCTGTLTLQTLTAVAASSTKHAAKKILTLAAGSFSLSAGSKSVTLHLSSTARALLAHSHGVLRVKLTVLSRGTGDQKNSVSTHVVTLRLRKK